MKRYVKNRYVFTYDTENLQQKNVCNPNFQDLHSSAWNGYLGGGTTFGFYLDTMCLLYLTTVILVFIFIDFGMCYFLICFKN